MWCAAMAGPSIWGWRSASPWYACSGAKGRNSGIPGAFLTGFFRPKSAKWRISAWLRRSGPFGNSCRRCGLWGVLGHACGELAPHLFGARVRLLQPGKEFGHPVRIRRRARLGDAQLGVRRGQGMLTVGEQFLVQFFAGAKTGEFNARS